VEFKWDFATGAESRPLSKTILRFWRPDRKRLLQVGSELFAVNDLVPDPGWADLRPLFEERFPHFLEVMQPREIVKAVMRYLNRIDLPDGLLLSDLLTIAPHLPGEPGSRPPFQMILDQADDTGPSALSLSYPAPAGSPSTTSEERALYALDFVVESGAKPLGGVEAISQWAEMAHDRIIELFESSITVGARSLFGQRVDS